MGPMDRGPRSARKLAAGPLYEFALRALGRRSLTRAEMKAKLAPRCVDEEDVDAVIDRLAGQGYLDDGQVAETHSAIRREYSLVGRRRVVGELRRRGVGENAARSAVEDAYQGTDEAALAADHLARKLGSRYEPNGVSDRKEITRLYRALARAGFAPPAISCALRQVASDTEWLEALADADEADA